MKTSLRLFLLLSLLVINTSSFAQLTLVNEPDKPSVQAAEMTRYGKLNPQLYTGKVSVPTSSGLSALSNKLTFSRYSISGNKNGFIFNTITISGKSFHYSNGEYLR